MKRFAPILAGVFMFAIGIVLALSVSGRGKARKVVVAVVDMQAGHTISQGDVKTAVLSNAPAGAFADPSQVIGKTLAVPRMAGDVITQSALGGVPDPAQQLKPNERAVAVKVSMSSGVAGLLRPGDHVGVTMVLNRGLDKGLYAKATVENLRVLWVSPEFQVEYNETDLEDKKSGLSVASPRQAREGVVVLAVPVSAEAVVYDFSDLGLPPETRRVSAVELLSALDQGGSGVKLSLYLSPTKALPLTTAGLYLPNLVVTPGATPTPTPAPASAP